MTRFTFRATVVALLLTMAVGAAPASANHEPACTNRGNAGGNSANYTGSNNSPDVVADDSEGRPNDKVKVHGCGYQPSSNVDFTFNSTPVSLGSTTTDAFGAFEVELTVPTGAAVGHHTITATGTAANGQAKVESVNYTVVPAAAAKNQSGQALPRTGSDVAALVVAAVLLLAIGTALVITVRRRRTAVAA